MSISRIPSVTSLPYSMSALVAQRDKVVCQLLDGCCGVACDHALVVVGDEERLCGFDDDDAVSAL